MDEKEKTGATFYEFLGEHKLMGTRCTCDGQVFLPPRAYCPQCEKGEMEWVEMGGKGKLLAYTIVYIGTGAMLAAGFDRKNPYCVGVVELEEGPKISAMITGVDVKNPASIQIGSPVVLDVQDLGAEGAKKAVLAFRPA